jgi:hypothetical protein
MRKYKEFRELAQVHTSTKAKLGAYASCLQLSLSDEIKAFKLYKSHHELYMRYIHGIRLALQLMIIQRPLKKNFPLRKYNHK